MSKETSREVRFLLLFTQLIIGLVSSIFSQDRSGGPFLLCFAVRPPSLPAFFSVLCGSAAKSSRSVCRLGKPKTIFRPIYRI